MTKQDRMNRAMVIAYPTSTLFAVGGSAAFVQHLLTLTDNDLNNEYDKTLHRYGYSVRPH